MYTGSVTAGDGGAACSVGGTLFPLSVQRRPSETPAVRERCIHLESCRWPRGVFSGMIIDRRGLIKGLRGLCQVDLCLASSVEISRVCDVLRVRDEDPLVNRAVGFFVADFNRGRFRAINNY